VALVLSMNQDQSRGEGASESISAYIVIIQTPRKSFPSSHRDCTSSPRPNRIVSTFQSRLCQFTFPTPDDRMIELVTLFHASCLMSIISFVSASHSDRLFASSPRAQLSLSCSLPPTTDVRQTPDVEQLLHFRFPSATTP
jgi:hypothetical protein